MGAFHVAFAVAAAVALVGFFVTLLLGDAVGTAEEEDAEQPGGEDEEQGTEEPSGIGNGRTGNGV